MYHRWEWYDVLFLRYGAWWTEFFAILNHFLLFYPLKTGKIKILKKWKKYLEISFYTNMPKIMIICYTVPEIWYIRHVILIFYLGLFFVLLPPNDRKNQNFQKIWKRHGDIIVLHMCTKNNDQMMFGSWNWCVMDGWMEKVTYRGGCPT